MFRFQSPIFFLLLLLPLLKFLLEKTIRAKPATLLFSQLGLLKKAQSKSPSQVLGRLTKVLLPMAMIFFVLALARPQRGSEIKEDHTLGIDILLAIDVSGSMRAMDFQPDNRLSVVKTVVDSFISARSNDRLALLSFSSYPFLRSPLTTDTSALRSLLSALDFSDDSGTAIGLAIASGVSRLKDSKAKSRIMILLTDGASNAGEIQPITAAELAKTFGIRIYTIAVGKNGPVPFPMQYQNPFSGKIETRIQNVEIPVDEDGLKEISKLTDGQFFRATDTDTLKQIYENINNLEKSDIPVRRHYRYQELFMYPLSLGVIFLLLSLIFEWFLRVRVP